MIEISRLLIAGDKVNVNINGMMRIGIVQEHKPMSYIVVDCSPNRLQPKLEKYYWTYGAEGWLSESAYNSLPKPPGTV